MMVNFSNIKAADVERSVNTEGRVSERGLDFSGLGQVASTVVEGVKRFKQGKLAAGTDEFLAEEQRIRENDLGGDFVENPVRAEVDQVVSTLEASESRQVSEGERNLLTRVAEESRRMRQAEEQNPNKRTMFELRRIKFAREQLAANPELAGELRSLIWNQSSFISRRHNLEDDTAKLAAEQAAENDKRLYDSIKPIVETYRQDLLSKGLSPQEMYQQLVADGDLTVFQAGERAKTELELYNAQAQQGQVIEAGKVRKVVRQGVQATTLGVLSQWTAITNDPTMRDNKDAQAEAIQSYFRTQETNLIISNPNLSATEIREGLEPVRLLVQSYVDGLKSSGIDAANGKIFQETVRLRAYQNIVKADPDFPAWEAVADLARNAGDYMQRQVALGALGSPAVQDLLRAAGIAKGYQDNGRARADLSGLSSQELRRYSTETKTAGLELANNWDNLDDVGKTTLLSRASDLMLDTEAGRSDEGLKAGVELLANDRFLDISKTSEFRAQFGEKHAAAVRRWEERLNTDVSQQIVAAKGKANLVVDPSDPHRIPLLTASAAPGQVSRLNNDIRNIIKAQAHLNGTTYQQAAIEFWERQMPLIQNAQGQP